MVRGHHRDFGTAGGYRAFLRLRIFLEGLASGSLGHSSLVLLTSTRTKTRFPFDKFLARAGVRDVSARPDHLRLERRSRRGNGPI